jgi:hypothetical protein
MHFANLFELYGVEDATGLPVPGARALRIENPAADFPFLYLLARQLGTLSPGPYVFSVYVRGDRPGLRVALAPGFEAIDGSRRFAQPVGTQWTRLQATFNVDERHGLRPAPVIVLPARGVYWIAAPQLEQGRVASAYAPAAADELIGTPSAAHRDAVARDLAVLRAGLAAPEPHTVTLQAEYDVYAGESRARLRVANLSGREVRGSWRCGPESAAPAVAAAAGSSLVVGQGESRIIAVPIDGWALGVHRCTLEAAGDVAATRLRVVAGSRPLARINHFRHQIEVDGAGFYLCGISAGATMPKEWYVADIVAHGINTLFFVPQRVAGGRFDEEQLASLVAMASRHRLRLVIGPAVAGGRDASWPGTLAAFERLIARFRDSAPIIGWWLADEPHAEGLRAGELRDLHERIKALDPGRLALVNWTSDDVPQQAGSQPHGSLAASDLYSVDYYPFWDERTSLEGYASRTLRAFRTGAALGTPGHVWMQLYGSGDAYREPTLPELRYMAYVNLLYGAGFSYWQSKSNSRRTWQGLAGLDGEVLALARRLWLDPAAMQTGAPMLTGNLLHAEWRVGGERIVVAIHVAGCAEAQGLELGHPAAPSVQATDYFSGRPVAVSGQALSATYGAYEARVYRVSEAGSAR